MAMLYFLSIFHFFGTILSLSYCHIAFPICLYSSFFDTRIVAVLL